MSNKKDALGNDLVIGQLYGYTQKDGGWTHITIGEAVSETEKRVTLNVKARRRYLYDKESPSQFEGKPAVSVGSHILFPVYAEGEIVR